MYRDDVGLAAFERALPFFRTDVSEGFDPRALSVPGTGCCLSMGREKFIFFQKLSMGREFLPSF